MPATTSSPSSVRSITARSTRARRVAGMLLVGLLAVAAAGACGGSETTVPATGAGAVPAPAGATGAEPVGTSVNARFAASVTVRTEPSAAAPSVTTLGPTTPLGSPSSALVVDQRDGWVQVSLPTRPNGSTGWVPRDAVELRDNPYAITVDRSTRRLVLHRDGEVELEAPVADGTEVNPTPAGTFYVTDLVETDDPAGAYGPYALGLSGHSETLSEFAGGDGQLGLHGTNDPATIGQSVSHGCVRVTNEVITTLFQTVPLGTPVTIS
jgi:lipoprotein-anchoring transpeptidase ErfK/SrfK